jgi:hypothetical protein
MCKYAELLWGRVFSHFLTTQMEQQAPAVAVSMAAVAGVVEAASQTERQAVHVASMVFWLADSMLGMEDSTANLAV